MSKHIERDIDIYSIKNTDTLTIMDKLKLKSSEILDKVIRFFNFNNKEDIILNSAIIVLFITAIVLFILIL